MSINVSYCHFLSLINRSLMREHFASLGNSAHPDSSDPRTRAITRFQELLLVSFREFSVISEDTILSERRKFRNETVKVSFSKDQAGLIYDVLYKGHVRGATAACCCTSSITHTIEQSEPRSAGSEVWFAYIQSVPE